MEGETATSDRIRKRVALFLDSTFLNDDALPEGFSRAGFELTVFVPIVVTLGVGVLFYVLGRGTRAQSVDLPIEAEAPAAL